MRAAPDAAAGEIVEFAPAKVNLALHVVGQRADGYHLLDMRVVFPRLGDWVALAPAAATTLDVDGPMAGSLAATSSEDNLVLRAARAVAALPGCGRPVAIRLTKNLPIQSGIGGGSADAAATLRALCRLHGRDPLGADIRAIAARLGADIPMCLHGRPLRARGVGDEIMPAAAGLSLALVLANPGIGLSTPSVFRALENRVNPPLQDYPAPPCDGLTLLAHLDRDTRNDLTAPAVSLAPVIDDVLAALRELPQSRFVRMSGSGSTCFALFDDLGAAERGAALLGTARPQWWIAAAPVNL